MILAILLFAQTDVADLVRKLESEPYAAMEALIARGPEALPALEASKLVYAAVAAEEIRAARDLGDRCAAPKRITLKAEKMRVSQLARKLTEEFGVAVDERYIQRTDTEISVDVKDATFFEALLAVCKEASLRFMLREGKLMLMSGAESFVTFRHAAVGIQSVSDQRIVDFSGTARRHLTLALRAYADPSLKMIDASGAVDVVEARDDTGADLLKGASTEVRPGIVARPDGYFDVNLGVPARGAKKLSLLRGYVPFRVPGRTENGAIEGLASRDVGPVRVTVRSVDRGMTELPLLKVAIAARDGKPETLRDVRVRFGITMKDGTKLGGSASGYGTLESDAVIVHSVAGVSLSGVSTSRIIRSADEGPEPPAIPVAVASLDVTVYSEIVVKRCFFELRDVPIE